MLCLGSFGRIAVELLGDVNGFLLPFSRFNDFFRILLRVCFELTIAAICAFLFNMRTVVCIERVLHFAALCGGGVTNLSALFILF
jgi:hypothetical protein